MKIKTEREVKLVFENIRDLAFTKSKGGYAKRKTMPKLTPTERGRLRH